MLFKAKRIVCLALSLVLILSLNLSFGISAVAEENVVQPRLQYTNYVSTSFTEGAGGTLTCLAEAEGYSDLATKVTIKMELQKHNMIKWETVTTWTSTFNTYYGTLSKTKTVTTGGLYRVKATFTVYSGSAYETITAYSGEDYITP